MTGGAGKREQRQNAAAPIFGAPGGAAVYHLRVLREGLREIGDQVLFVFQTDAETNQIR